jgi:predicted MPP superfamily phosphohydrolase
MGFCFDCVEAESIIVEGVDMHDKPPPKVEGLSQTMSNLQAILKKYVKISNDE